MVVIKDFIDSDSDGYTAVRGIGVEMRVVDFGLVISFPRVLETTVLKIAKGSN